MKKGERNIFLGIAIVIIVLMVFNAMRQSDVPTQEKELPFYSEASADLQHKAGLLYKELGCKSCHSLWTVRDIMRNVPAPALDGIGSLRSRQWLFDYLSAPDPQTILPSRLKKEYQMPSMAYLSVADRNLLAEYLGSLKVKEWYLDELRRSECKKLTGTDC